jgi:phosphohistidine swiveling domain-containing protein
MPGVDTFGSTVVTTKQQHPLGSMAISRDGRMFRYASVGATDTVMGSLYQSAAPIANHLALTSAAQAVGDGFPVPIVVTPGATAGAANLYAEGYLGVDTTPENGRTYSISGHAAITSRQPPSTCI